jgi:hypothetical protein
MTILKELNNIEVSFLAFIAYCLLAIVLLFIPFVVCCIGAKWVSLFVFRKILIILLIYQNGVFKGCLLSP